MGQDLMQQQKISASLQLMQNLLTCPRGEEWILLKRHEDLVDADFVQLMEQVATQLQQEGDRPAATFLRNWAAQLHHVLLREALPPMSELQPSPAQLALIQQLIEAAPADLDQLLEQSKALVRPELVQVIQQVAQQLLEKGKTQTAQLLKQLAFQVNQAWIQRHLETGAPATAAGAESEQAAGAPLASQAAPAAAVRAAPPSAVTSPAAAKVALPPEEVVTPGQPGSTAHTGAESFAGRRSPPSKQQAFKAISATQAAVQPPSFPDPWQGDAAPLSSALQLKVPQQIANALHEVTLLLHELNKSIASQTVAIQTLTRTAEKALDASSSMSENPLWYMDILERAQSSDWIISTDELTHLIGVKPQCHGDEVDYIRGCWKFEKVGKLGSQNGWRVHKR